MNSTESTIPRQGVCDWSSFCRVALVLWGLAASFSVGAESVPGLDAYQRRDLKQAERELRLAASSLTTEQLGALLTAFADDRKRARLGPSSYYPLIEALAPALEAAPPSYQRDAAIILNVNESRSHVLLARAAERGDSQAQSIYASVLPRSKDALRYEMLRRAAEGGYPPAQYVWGNLLAQENANKELRHYVAYDPAQGRYWLRKAAEAGEMLAQVNLGWMLAAGEGGPQDCVEALRWLERSRESWANAPDRRYAFMYRDGICVEKDTATYLHLLKRTTPNSEQR